MGSARANLVTRLLALVGLALCAALLVNHVRPNPRFCGYESDCEDVLFSRFGSVLGVPLPVFGVVLFAAVFAASLFPGSRARRVLRLLAAGGGVGGCTLILIQVAVLGRLCRFCLMVDVIAVALAVVQLAWGRGVEPLSAVRLRFVWAAAAVIAAGLGAAFGTAGSHAGREDRPVPPEVSALWVHGKVNVVEVADFQCPHCRRMHAVLVRFLEEEGDHIHFVRLTAPMPAHEQARHASRAFLCACEQGKGDEMAEALFAAPDLAPRSCERVAASLGLSLPAFRACAAAPATDARLDADLAWVRAASPRGLPVVWVQGRMFFGEQPIEALRRAARAAERTSEVGGVEPSGRN
jgi:uncharacterized membrane protein/protein-disulfide isomerase